MAVGDGMRRWGAWLLGAAAAALIAGTVVVAGRVGEERAAVELGTRAAAALPLATTSLAAVIEKQRLIPTVLARDPEVIATLFAPDEPARASLDGKLADIAAEANSAVIYLVGRDGVAIASSNGFGASKGSTPVFFSTIPATVVSGR